MTVDIAHPPLAGNDAEQLLDESLRSIQHSSRIRIMKIIHGYGSSGKGGSLKTLAQNWSYSKRTQVRAIIAGEEITSFNHDAQQLAAECQVSIVSDLGPANQGMTIVWVK